VAPPLLVEILGAVLDTCCINPEPVVELSPFVFFMQQV
jgi:hypothetical protein